MLEVHDIRLEQDKRVELHKWCSAVCWPNPYLGYGTASLVA